jgi:hypothetical protein
LTYICKYTSKGTSKGSGAEEQRNAILSLTSLVPHGKVKYDAGKQATFRDTEEETSNEEASEVLDHAEKGGNNTPCDGESRKPEAGRCSLEDDVAWNLENICQYVTG